MGGRAVAAWEVGLRDVLLGESSCVREGASLTIGPRILGCGVGLFCGRASGWGAGRACATGRRR